ncbi:MAG: hypothetical protein AAFR61_20930 [Bacteroidota bacterium]
MRTSIFVLSIFLSLSEALLANPTYQLGDELYVWAPSGLNARMEPGISGKKIGKWEFGTKLKVLAKTDRAFSTSIIKNELPESWEGENRDARAESALKLRGQWVKVQGPTFVGYVVDVYLIGMRPPRQKTSLLAYLETWGKAPVKIDTTWLENCDGGPGPDCYEYAGKASSGVEINGSVYSVGGDESIGIPGLSLQQGLVLYNYFSPIEDGNRSKIDRPALVLMTLEKDYIYLVEDELCELGFRLEGGMLWISYGCSC